MLETNLYIVYALVYEKTKCSKKDKWLKWYQIIFSFERKEKKISSPSQDLLFFPKSKLLNYSQKINEKFMNYYLVKS